MTINELREKAITTHGMLLRHFWILIVPRKVPLLLRMMQPIPGWNRISQTLVRKSLVWSAQEALEAELSKPVNMPLTSKPSTVTQPDMKTGRASDAYKAGMLTALRSNFKQISNVLQEGVDADGGYLVPDEL